MKKIALLFPGQGSQYVGMGKALHDQFDLARQIYQEANDTLGFDLRAICFEGSTVDLHKVENALPAILTVSVAAFRAYRQEVGVLPVISAGHSLGEYTALVCSGALCFADALRIVRLRSVLAETVGTGVQGAMTVVNGIDRLKVSELCQKRCDAGQIVTIACDNAPEQVVIAGYRDAVMQVEDQLMEENAQITPLLISPPFHSPLLEPMVRQLQEEISSCGYGRFQWPVIANVTGLPYTGVHDIPVHLPQQLVKTVQWRKTVSLMKEMGVDLFIEIGPQAVLTDLLKANLGEVKAFSFGGMTDRQALTEYFSVEKVSDFPLYPPTIARSYTITVVTKCLAHAVSTKNRNKDNDAYEQGVVEPYRKIQTMQQELHTNHRLPTKAQMLEALEMLRSVFRTKKTPIEEQTRRFRQILKETETEELLAEFDLSS